MGSLPLNFGSLSGRDAANKWDAFLVAARALRDRLGSNAYLADRYIGFMLDAANNFHSESVNADGFDAGRDLYGLCQGIANGDGDMTSHPFHETAAAYIQSHPLPGQGRHTRAWAYFIALFGKYLEYAVASYEREAEANTEEIVDEDTLQELGDRIMALLDGDDDALFESMRLRFSECFASCSTLSSFLNGATYQLIEALSHCDSVTGQRVFQVLLDHPLEPA